MVKVGDKVPHATLRGMGPEGPKAITTEELFAPGKKVVAFALPGAFTPTCSAKHLPGFKQKAEEIKSKGVDTISCLSVNDAFVMRAWAEDQAVGDDITMLADGSGDFTRALGLVMDARGFGMGERSQRYSLIANDGAVEQLNVEAAGEFRVSSADYLLEHL